MKQIKRIIFYILIGLSILGIPVFSFGIINTMVSLKYETENPTDCISLVTGQDLCITVQILKTLVIVCIVTIILLLVFRKRILSLK
jgi:ABC-type Mn2+/Zn2+ transport system permease subunit